MVIPTYNRASLLKEALVSVFNQDVENCRLEVIVVDDGSNDDTSEVVKGFPLRYVRQANSGAGVARNRGIEMATGEWVAFLDSDDLWLPTKLSLQLAVAEAFPEYHAIHSEFKIAYEAGVVEESGLMEWARMLKGTTEPWADVYTARHSSQEFGILSDGKSFDIYGGNVFRHQMVVGRGTCVTLLVKRAILRDGIEFAPDYRTWEDYWFFCKLSEKHDLLFLDTPTAINRGHSGERLTGQNPILALQYHIDVCKKIYMSSTVRNRPSDLEIADFVRSIRADLFKHLVRQGRILEALSFLHEQPFSLPLSLAARTVFGAAVNKLVNRHRTIG